MEEKKKFHTLVLLMALFPSFLKGTLYFNFALTFINQGASPGDSKGDGPSFWFCLYGISSYWFLSKMIYQVYLGTDELLWGGVGGSHR